MKKYVSVSWPEIRKYQDKPGFNDNAYPLQDDTSAYMIERSWFDK